MSANIKKILIIGATSGLGEAFARHFHSTGKKVIAAGRRIERLHALESELPGLETIQLDVTDFANLESKLSSILSTHPDLDSVFIMSGKQDVTDFKNPASTSSPSIISEVNTNLIAPLLISRVVVPHLLALPSPATLITVSSGLAFVPVPKWPVYDATKSGIHAFSVALRSQLAGTNVHVIELAPPHVDTPLDLLHRGDPGKVPNPMPLDEYMATAVKGFETEGVKEIATGFSEIGVKAWRGAFGPILEHLGFRG
ncbi:putative oxidoreductase DltE [Lachnellula cervina]|uniref:Putative oxidoreductase DltE n=1 Tax=Lachnellula cervina TaxID=1316786 RepID=A0A7D8UMY0_9HELO|nr:putative oxidoreductase DltE [Lachnellula cervina]